MTSSKAPRVSFVVVNWNRRDLLEQCLQSIAQQSAGDFEVVLVDNGSIDGSLDCLQGLPLPSVTLIRNSTNLGFAQAVNQGIRRARGRLIALVNNDIRLDRRWLEEIQHGFDLQERAGMCAGKILLAQEPGRIDKVGHLLYPDGQNYGRGHREEDRGQYDRVEEVLWPDGAAAIYRTELFQDVGLFDESFFAYGEDAELGLRARLRGWKCLYIPTAVAYHHHSATLGPYSPRKIFLVERNRIWLAVKLFPAEQLMKVPFYSGLRYFYSGWGLWTNQGDVGRSTANRSVWVILWAVLKAQIAALIRIPALLKERQRIQRTRTLSREDFAALLRNHSLSARRLVLLD